MTLDEYLAFEARSPIRHEYIAGEVFAMSGATTRHNLITLNLARHLHGIVGNRPCRVFASEVKLRVADRVYYPDVMLVCGRAASADLIIEEPLLVVEVTSPSTRGTDRREKLEAYRRVPSLGAYLIVDQRRRHVVAHARGPASDWLRQEFAGGESVSLPMLDARLPLDAIYEGIELPPLAVGEGTEGWDEEGA